MKQKLSSSKYGRRLSVAVSAFAIALMTAATASAQITGTPSGGRKPDKFVDTPIPDGDLAAIVKDNGLVLTDKPVKEMISNWRKPKKIIVSVDDNSNRIAWLQKVAPGVKLVPVYSNKEAMKEIVDADAQLGGECMMGIVDMGKEIRWVQQSHTGMEHCFEGKIPQRLATGAIVVTNNKRMNSLPIAWHAIALMATLDRGLDVFVKQMDSGKPDRSKVPRGRMAVPIGQTMLIVGLGGIGTDIAKMAHDLGMKVIGTRNSSREGPDYVEYVGLANELPTLVGRADVVVIASPLTNETQGMFNKAIFDKMKRGALLINIARQPEIVDADLIEALKSGQVGGAGLDGDPGGWASDNPIFKAPNVIITPHTASAMAEDQSLDGGEESWVLMRENLRRYVIGDRMYSWVNPKLGY